MIFGRAYREVKRLAVPIGILIGIATFSSYLGEFSKLMLFAYKFSLVSLAAIVAHMIRSEMFPYIDLKTALKSQDRGYAIGSSIVVATVFASIVLALCLGL